MPLPETPVTAVRTPAGISTSIERRLFAGAPVIRMPGRGRPGRGGGADDLAARYRPVGESGFADRERTSLGHDPAAVASGPRAHVDHMVRRADDIGVVLDDDDGIAPAGHSPEQADESGRIARVETDRRFVENIGHTGKAGAQHFGQPQPLGFASGKRGRAAVDTEVIQSDVSDEA